MSKIVIFVLSGGLGNQLFQIAAAANFAFRNKRKVYIDTSYLKINDKKLNYGCSEVVKKLNAKGIVLIDNPPLLIRLILKFRIINNFFPFNFFFKFFIRNIFEKTPYTYEDLKDHYSLITIFTGYWQSEKYFSDCKLIFDDVIKNVFSLKKNLLNSNNDIFNKKSRKTAVHFRLGDYNYLSEFGVLDLNYYSKSIKIIKKKNKNSSFVFFSDEIEKVKHQKIFKPNYYFNDFNMKPEEILSYMSSCDDFIISNSTFSWWAAYIGQDINKFVIAPKKWLKANLSANDLILSRWKRVYNNHSPLKQRIYYVIPNFNVVGAQRTVIDIGKALLKRDYEVFWITGEQAQSKNNNKDFSFELEKNRIIKFASKIKYIPKIRVVDSLIRLFLLTRRLHKDSVIVSITPFLNRYLCFLKMFGFIKSKLIIEDHAYPIISNKDEFSTLIRFFYYLTEGVYNFADKLRVLSEENMLYYKKKIFSNTKVIHFPNLIDSKRILNLANKKNKFSKKSKKRLVFIGRFTSQKNLQFIIKSLSLIIKELNIEFFIIGYGPQENYLKSLVINLGLKRNIFFIKSSNKNYSILKSAKIFPAASLWEGLPLTMAEAMLLNVFVVSTNFIAGPKFYLGKNNERGFIVRQNNIFSFAKALKYALLNPQKIKTKIAKAKLFVSKKMDIEKNLAKYCNTIIN
jgi:glycosyltransferase involved in cell wall biosynthesis